MKKLVLLAFLSTLLFNGACTDKKSNSVLVQTDENGYAILSDPEIEDIVKRSYQYVAMYNVNQKMALAEAGLTTHGYNKGMRNTNLLDHTARFIARPNNDVMYQLAMLDLTQDAIILEMPAVDSKYVSMMATGYDHYVNIPMSTGAGDFQKPTKILFYTKRTKGYDGAAIEGIDKIAEMTGDYISVVLRIMPHANDPERFARIVEQINAMKGISLSEYLGKPAPAAPETSFPPYGKTDADIFENNLLEVMQFVFNHTTFDPNFDLDKAVLADYARLGVEPGKEYDPATAVKLDGKKFSDVSIRIRDEELARWNKPEEMKDLLYTLFLPKGSAGLQSLLTPSVVGPIGQPAKEALYPAVITADGTPMNAMNDYAIHIAKEDMPPAKGFWSFTLYDAANGFFIPNDQKKYSVGENSGMKLNDEGGIDIYIAEKQPKGVPAENWLPINREDLEINMILRIYAPDLEAMKTWKAPVAEKLE